MPCEQCNSSPTKLLDCGRCHSVRYCDKKCQLLHWPVHKTMCKTLAHVLVGAQAQRSAAGAGADYDSASKPVEDDEPPRRMPVKQETFSVFLDDDAFLDAKLACCVCKKAVTEDDAVRCKECIGSLLPKG